MNDAWTDRLSDYVDGELPPEQQNALEAHLALCDACAATLAGLRTVVARAGSLEDSPPHADLWAGIAGRLDEGPGRAVIELSRRRPASPRRLSFSLSQLAAASIALAVLSGAAAWHLATREAGPQNDGGAVAVSPGPEAVSTVSSPVPLQYEDAVAELERVLVQQREYLDTATVRVLEHNLALIDRAIDDARSALAADPANTYLNGYLAENLRRKIDLMRRATTLASART